MPRSEAAYFARPDQGGLQRDPATIASHRMLGALDAELLQNTVDLAVSTAREDGEVAVTIELINTGAGHHVPTDSPLRQMLLVVTATGADGQSLTLVEGPTLPDWAGDLADQPGAYFALILQEVWTQVQPSGAYWNPTRVVEDTRLPAFATHS